MATQLLVVSDDSRDATLASFVGETVGMTVRTETSPRSVREFLLDHPQTIVFWGADNEKKAADVAKSFAGQIPPSRVFAITEGALTDHPHLFSYQVFCHHLFRRFADPFPSLCAKLVAATLMQQRFGLARYLPAGATTQKITLGRSGHKNAAVEAIRNFFVKQQVNSRMATVAAQAADELVMNAIFDAPVAKATGTYRRGIDRQMDFELASNEKVDIEVGSGGGFTGLCVADQFGSFTKQSIMKYLEKDYAERAYIVRSDDRGAGLGIHGIINSGLGVLFVAKGGVRTEVMVFFPSAATYKEFRAGPRFISILAE